VGEDGGRGAVTMQFAHFGRDDDKAAGNHRHLMDVVKGRVGGAVLPYEAAIRKRAAVAGATSGAEFAYRVDPRQPARPAAGQKPWHRRPAAAVSTCDPGPTGSGVTRLPLDADTDSNATGTSATTAALTNRGGGGRRKQATVKLHEQRIDAELQAIAQVISRGDFPAAIARIAALLKDVSLLSQISETDSNAHVALEANVRFLLGSMYAVLGEDALAVAEFSSAIINSRRVGDEGLYRRSVAALAERYVEGGDEVLVPVINPATNVSSMVRPEQQAQDAQDAVDAVFGSRRGNGGDEDDEEEEEDEEEEDDNADGDIANVADLAGADGDSLGTQSDDDHGF
jgi:hypothetical protein